MNQTIDRRHLRTRVFDVLKHQGRDMQWLSRKTGFDPNYLWQIKSGRRAVTESFIQKSIEALDMPFDALFFADVSSEIDNSTTDTDGGTAA